MSSKSMEFTQKIVVLIVTPAIGIFVIPSTLILEIKILYVFNYWIALAIIYLIHKTWNCNVNKV